MGRRARSPRRGRRWQRGFFATSVSLSVSLVRLLQPIMPLFTNNPVGRTSFGVLLPDPAFGETQQGAAKGTIKGRLVGGGARGRRL